MELTLGSDPNNESIGKSEKERSNRPEIRLKEHSKQIIFSNFLLQKLILTR